MKYVVVAMLSLGLAGCGAELGLIRPVIGDPTKATVPRAAKVMVFASPNTAICPECPEIGKSLRQAPQRIKVELWVVTGAGVLDPPTQEIADRLHHDLGLAPEVTAHPDPWRWQTFDRYFLIRATPAAVALDISGGVVKTWGPGTLVLLPPPSLYDFLAAQSPE